MFELGIFSVIVLAVGYWMALWLMGRHDDVLHGDFVSAEAGSDPAPPLLPAPASRVDSTEALQSLLTAIKRDLKDAAQI
ncbi:MAG: hypothetical protein JWR80_4754 [Bradyrhizobium sp.]|nr:hypothetical protein [Bradyrhizobium sp.]